MTLVVTGALGHIGSAFIRHLRLHSYDRVLLLDDLSSERYCSLFNLPAGVPFTFVKADIRTAQLAALFAGADVVVHLAALTNAAESASRAAEVFDVNYAGTRRVADACLETGARLIFASTTSAYGPQDAIVDEACREEALKPQSPYAESKLAAERYLASLGSRRLCYSIVRFGTIFGVSAGMRFHTAVNKFCWQAVVGEPLTVWRTALDQRRPYLHVDDAARSLEFVIEHDLFDNDVYNIVTTNATVRNILDMLAGEVAPFRIQFVDSPIMNQLSYTVSNERFRRAGFEFHGDLAAGVRDTVRLLGRGWRLPTSDVSHDPTVVERLAPIGSEASARN
jgi:nucleoside-diphosphate-sugar epimerase